MLSSVKGLISDIIQKVLIRSVEGMTIEVCKGIPVRRILVNKIVLIEISRNYFKIDTNIEAESRGVGFFFSLEVLTFV